MDLQNLTIVYRKAFGDEVPLPIAFGYSLKPEAEVVHQPRCMIGAISKVRHGQPLTLSADNVTCGGGGLYTAFKPMPERVPIFVSETEHYKQTPEMVKSFIADMDIQPAEKPYLNFVRLDHLKSLDEVEGIICFATPDRLSGLCAWAFYDNNDPLAVSTPFGSGCSSIITQAVRENRRHGRSCFIGLLDPSARLLVPADELTFVIPTCRLVEMMQTIEHSALFQKAYTLVRKRINGQTPAREA